MSKPIVNGETAHSKVLSHITSYPVVHDSIDLYKSNAYGQKSISLATDAYDRLAKPFFPYLQGPFSYVKPYVEKADSLADDGLTKVDSRFPIVKEETEKVKGTVLDLAFFPLRLAGESKNYVLGTFNDEYSKTNGEGIFKLVKATISTELKFGVDAYNLVLNYWTKGKETAQTKVNEKTKN